MTAENISRIASDFETQLSSAIAVGATQFTIQSVTDNDGNTLSDGIYAFTVDRDNSDQKEYFIGQLTNATKTVSSISSVSRQGVLTANAQRSHRIGGNVIISDHSILSALSRIFNGLGKINPAAPLEYDTAPNISSANQLATKGYVDSVVTGGTINTDRVIVGSQTAGETVAAGNIVYFKASDQRWWLADADNTDWSNRTIGIALGSGTAGNAIADGVQLYGKCDLFSGLTAGSLYYLSGTAGGIATSAGTNQVIIGNAEDADTIFFNPTSAPSSFVSTSAGVADAGKGVKLNASGVVDETMIPFDYVKTIGFSSGIFTRANDAASEVQTIAHGLSGTPSRVSFTVMGLRNNDMSTEKGVFDGSGQRNIWVIHDDGSTGLIKTDSSNAISLWEMQTSFSDEFSKGVVSVDATNITITWTKSGNPNTVTYTIMWEAEYNTN
jgi:hypothetical protein